MQMILNYMRAALAAAAMIALVAAPAAAEGLVERGAVRSFDGTPIVYNLFLPDGASASSQRL